MNENYGNYVKMPLNLTIYKVVRDIYPKYDQWLWRILEHGPYEYNFKPVELVEIFDHAKVLQTNIPYSILSVIKKL